MKNMELKSCPFCGDTNITVDNGIVRFNYGLTCYYNMVCCNNCGGRVLVSKDKDAVDVWNKRVETN